jgi:hypothetical protein
MLITPYTGRRQWPLDVDRCTAILTQTMTDSGACGFGAYSDSFYVPGHGQPPSGGVVAGHRCRLGCLLVAYPGCVRGGASSTCWTSRLAVARPGPAYDCSCRTACDGSCTFADWVPVSLSSAIADCHCHHRRYCCACCCCCYCALLRCCSLLLLLFYVLRPLSTGRLGPVCLQ